MEHLSVGTSIEVHSVKFDGSPHRWWRSFVRSVDNQGVVLFTPDGTHMYGPKGGWASRGGLTRLWWNRWYNVYKAPDGAYSLVYYVHIALPPTLSGTRLTYVDLDLDVVLEHNGTVRILDEEEFAAATHLYGYPDDVVARARQTASEVQSLLLNSRTPWSELA